MKIETLRLRWLLACIVPIVIGCGNAAAASPDFTIVFPAGMACTFDLQIDGSGGNRHFKEFRDKDGNVVRTLDAGTGFALTFTNVSTGTVLTTRSNGAVSHVTLNPDGSFTETDTGHNVLILAPTDNPAGPSTTLIVGRVVFTVDVFQVFTVQQLTGKVADVCAALI